MQIIDFECDTPTKEAVEDTVRLIQSGRGFDKEGYAQQMAPGWAAQIGMSLEEFNEAKETVGLTALALKQAGGVMARLLTTDHARTLLAIGASLLYAAYLLTTQRVRAQMDTATFMMLSMAVVLRMAME